VKDNFTFFSTNYQVLYHINHCQELRTDSMQAVTFIALSLPRLRATPQTPTRLETFQRRF
jgi:hypothetical protein